MIDRSWLDRKLRAALWTLHKPVPGEERWSDVLDLWCTILDECDPDAVDSAIARSVEFNVIDRLSPGQIKSWATISGTTIRSVIDATCEVTGLTRACLCGPQRKRFVVRPRQAAMKIARDVTGASCPEISRAFGNRDHTTVLNACRKIEELMPKDPDLCEMIAAIELRVAP